VARSDYVRLLEGFPIHILGTSHGQQRLPVDTHHPKISHDILWAMQDKVVELLLDRMQKHVARTHISHSISKSERLIAFFLMMLS
jgi:hypothetical protein